MDSLIENVRRSGLAGLPRGWTVLLLAACSWVICLAAGAVILRLLF